MEPSDLLGQPIPEPTARRGHGYARTYREYEPVYGKKKRTIQYWVEKGEAHLPAPLYPPLDCPQDMPGWWDTVMDQKCPQPVLDAALRASGGGQPAPTPPATESPSAQQSAPVATSAGAPAPLDVALPDYEIRLQRNLSQRDAAHTALLDAQEEQPPRLAHVDLCRREFQQWEKAVMEAEAHALEMRKESGRLVSKELEEIELGHLLSSVALSIRALYRRLKPKLKECPDDAAEDAVWQDGIDQTYAELERSGYALPMTLA